jgi:hypothetical protein
MQAVNLITENWMSKRYIELVHRKGHAFLHEGLDRAEQEFCADVINQHLERVSGRVEVENELSTLTYAAIHRSSPVHKDIF